MIAATIRQGTAAPTDAVGVNGDFYLRTSTNPKELYQKVSGVYVLQGHVARITSGTAAPTGGNDGDIYLQYT